jgi:glutamyl-tRNA synthetase
VGGARTAIFNWLLARKEGAVLALRIEDTDRDRSNDEHTQAILDGLGWLGVDFDEGPVFQSEGVERHSAAALRLLEEGRAYRDFSDPEAVREEARDRNMHPSRVAREKAHALGLGEAEQRAEAGEPHAIRFRVPDGETVIDDLVHGEVRFGNDDIDDLVILRSDGTPVYNLAVVSDDAEMRITHVIRGDDHLSNTPKQVLLYRALGLPEPRFGHVPLILGPDGKRLSKRHGATAVGDYAKEGVLPAAMFNFLALLGWSPGDDREFMTREELVEAFSLDRVLKKSSVFDAEKLSWLNGKHLAARSVDELVGEIRGRLAASEGIDPTFLADTPSMEAIVSLLVPRSRTLEDLAQQAIPFLREPVVYDEGAVAKHWGKNPETTRDILSRLREALGGVEPWDTDSVEGPVRGVASVLEVGAGKVIHPLRVALVGQASSPGIFDVLAALGRPRVLSRIDRGLQHIPSS